MTPPSYPLAIAVLADNSKTTIIRLLEGTLIGMTAGIVLAMVMAWGPTLRRVFSLSTELGRMVPLLAIAPIFVLWFGGSEVGSVAYIAFGIFVMMVVYTFNAIRNVPPIYMDFAAALGARRAQIYRLVILPSAVPELVGGVRVAIGFGWAIVLGAELLTAPSGLGRLMYLSQQWGFVGRMIVILLLYMLYAFILDRILYGVARRLTIWME